MRQQRGRWKRNYWSYVSSSGNCEEAAGISGRLSCTLPPYYSRLPPNYSLLAVIQATKSWAGAWEWGYLLFMLPLMWNGRWVQLVCMYPADQAISGMPQPVDWEGGPHSMCCAGPNQQFKNKFLPLTSELGVYVSICLAYNNHREKLYHTSPIWLCKSTMTYY